MDSEKKPVLPNIHISCNVLKLIACVFMFIDHIGYGIIHNYMIAHSMDLLPEEYSMLNNIYKAFQGVGRMAFPIFCFFIVEGFLRTRNVTKYAIRLAVFGLISEIPFDIGLFGKVFYWEHQNVIITFFIAIVMLSTVKWLESNIFGLSRGVVVFAMLCAAITFGDIAFLLNTDYSWKCILAAFILYMTRDTGTFRLIAGAASMCWEKFAPISFVLLYFYDPSIKPKYKYAFYLFYPLNFIVIYLIARMII